MAACTRPLKSHPETAKTLQSFHRLTYNVLPNSSIFSQLLRHGYHSRLAIRDTHLGIERTYTELLSDVLAFREILVKSLSSEIWKSLSKGDEVYIGVIAAAGYEFAVAVLTVLAIGAAFVPMSVSLPVEEAAYFVTTAQQAAILASPSSADLANGIAKVVNRSRENEIKTLVIHPSFYQQPLSNTQIKISTGPYMNDNSSGAVIFTSGTTGPPKGVVIRRGFVHDFALAIAGYYSITPSDVILHVLPVHHASGLWINFFPFLIAGACIEFRSSSFDPLWMWKRWRQGGLTFFSGVPTIYMRMMRYFEQNLAKLPPSEREEFIHGACQFRGMLCGSSALPKPIQVFWTNLRRGKSILTRYGATEFAVVFLAALNEESEPEGAVGKSFPGIDVKLSDGQEGEILLKSPWIFSKYLFDDAATSAAFDESGYFRTGDIARREGEYYWIVGRASMDIIKSGGYKISALDIERELLSLPYISEAMVVGVEDDEFGQRVGAVVTLHSDEGVSSINHDSQKSLRLSDIRRDLRSKLVGYKLPTLLRIVQGELPKSQSGKVMKRELGPKLFPAKGWQKHPEIQIWRMGKAGELVHGSSRL